MTYLVYQYPHPYQHDTFRVDLDVDGEIYRGPVFTPNSARSARAAAEDYAAWSNRQSQLAYESRCSDFQTSPRSGSN